MDNDLRERIARRLHKFDTATVDDSGDAWEYYLAMADAVLAVLPVVPADPAALDSFFIDGDDNIVFGPALLAERAAVVRVIEAARAVAWCTSPVISKEATGGGDVPEVDCGECEGCKLADALAVLPDGLQGNE